MTIQEARPYAESVNFWQTGRSSPDRWIEAAKKQLRDLGGKIEGEAFGQDETARAAFLLAFSVKGEKFRIVWPVLPSRTKNESAARIQAATMLYHYVKSVALYAVVVGSRTAFLPHLVLSDGRVASQAADNELEWIAPRMLVEGHQLR